jgi:RNA polymerase sigma factor (sigma-70 family)
MEIIRDRIEPKLLYNPEKLKGVYNEANMTDYRSFVESIVHQGTFRFQNIKTKAKEEVSLVNDFSEQQHEDIVQTVMMQLVRDGKKIDNINSWLRETTIRKIIDWHRNEKRRRIKHELSWDGELASDHDSEEADLIGDANYTDPRHVQPSPEHLIGVDHTTPESEFFAKEYKEEIQAILQTLLEKYKNNPELKNRLVVFEKFVLENETYKDIAKQTELDSNAVTMQIYSIKQDLEKLYQAAGLDINLIDHRIKKDKE